MKIDSRFICCFIPLGLMSSASGALLQLTISGFGSGSLNFVDFTDSYTFVTVYDTDNITTFPTMGGAGPDGFFVVNDSASVTIGSTEVTITDPISHFLNPAFGTFGLGNDRVMQDMIIVSGAPEFASYDLSTPLGPINFVDGFVQNTFVWLTEAGEFTLVDDFPADITVEVSPVPEPSTGLLFLASFAPLLYRRHR